MPPAARLTDAHACPLTTGAVAHAGGPISGPGAPKVLIAGLVASTAGDTCVCVAPAPDAVAKGSLTVSLSGKPAARIGDTTAHGGAITAGYAKVLIG